MTNKKIDNNNSEDIMFDIADVIINEISDEPRFKLITQNFKLIYQEKASMSNEQILNDYACFLYETISAKFNNKAILSKVDLKRLRETSRINSWKLKKRLYKNAMDSLQNNSNKLLNKEYIQACEDYENHKKVKSLLNVETPNDLLEERKAFLDTWSSSIEYSISSYPYLKELTEKRIKTAFEQDIIFCVLEFIRYQYNYDINMIVLKTPAGMSPGLFIPHKRGRKPNTLAVTKKGDNFESKKYDVEDINGNELDTFYEFSMGENETEKCEALKLELTNKETEKKALTRLYLDELDLNIIRFVYTYSYKQKIPFYISDLLKYLGVSDSKANYKRVEDRLIKLPYYTFYTEKYDKRTDSKKRSSFNLFTRVDIETELSTKKRAANVTKAYVEEVEIVSTELMYKKELNKLKLEQSRNLAFFLEGRRSFEISNGVDIKNKKYTYSIDYLKWYVHLDNKKSLRYNMLYLEEGLKEIMKNQFIIKKYEINQSSFDVWFYEGFEKRMGLLNNTILSLEESNGNIIEL